MPEVAAGAHARPWPARVAGLAGWRRHLAAFAAGALATLALPPAHLIPVLVPALVILLWLAENAASRRTAFAAGWWWGFGYFVVGLYWITFALLVDAAQFWWMVPFAVAGLAAGFAVYIGVATLLLRWSGARGWIAIVLLAALWTLAEYARGVLFTGFPWNLLGQVWTIDPAPMQGAALVGVYGLGFATALAALLPAAWWRGRGGRRWLGPILAVALVALLWGGGQWRLAGAEARDVPGVVLRIVQPAIAQATKWSNELRDRHLLKTVELSRGPGWERVTHLVWPETAIPFFIAADVVRREAAATAVPPGGLLLTGAPRVADPGTPDVRIYNAVHVIAPDATIVATYDKFHLVPFGEYVPLRRLLPIPRLAVGSRDFSSGPGLTTIDVRGLPPFSPLICYEAIFPAAAMAPAESADWLLNLTNDAWFGITAGPHQHFAAVRLRAVEEGVPLVRAANNGISAVVDPYGRVRGGLRLGAAGVLDTALPAALDPRPPFARAGNRPILVITVMLAIVLLGVASSRRRSKTTGR